MEPWLENFARANFRRSADTAHDLKTPLNVAVLNLELLRMRLRKVTGGGDDEKLDSYATSIETELRRLGQIFDAFFILSTPPKSDEQPGPVDIASICAGFGVETDGPAVVDGHEPRIRQACKLFLEGAANVLPAERRATSTSDGSTFTVTVTGTPEAADLELTRIFKFYYSDSQGNPDLSLAAARLIAETYGGEVNAVEESGKVSLRLTFPLGAR